MKDTKLINYLSSLSKKEIKLFNDFVLSPYHNKSELIQQLWKYLKPFAPHFDSSKLDRPKVIKHLYQEVNNNTNKRFNDLNTTFCKVFEKFLVAENLNQNKNYQTRLLINAFGERRMSQYFYKTIEKAKKPIEKRTIKDIEDYEQLLFLETEYNQYPETSKYDIEDTSMQSILDIIYDYSTLLSLTRIKSAKQIEMFINKKFNYSKLQFTIDSQSKNILVILNKLIIKLASDKNQNLELVNKLANTFFEHELEITNRLEKQNILNFLINYASIHYRNDIRYYEPLNYYLKYGIESYLLINKGQFIHDFFFHSSSVVSCELKDTKWLDSLLNKYSKYLSTRNYNKYYKICEINYHFVNQNFEKVLSLISYINYESLSIQFWYRAMEVRTIYELYQSDEKYYDYLINKIDAYYKYCQRKVAVSKIKKESNINFIKVVKKLIHNNQLDKKNINELKNIIEYKAIICRLWLIAIFRNKIN